MSINGPAVSSKEGNVIIDSAVKQWNQVNRTKPPNVQRAMYAPVSRKVETSDAQVQTGDQGAVVVCLPENEVEDTPHSQRSTAGNRDSGSGRRYSQKLKLVPR